MPLNFKMFYIIGLGLGDAKDITVKGLEIVQKCDRIYLESYTSILTCGKEALVSLKSNFVMFCNYLVFVVFRKNFMERNS